ncbi:hypothetical protein DFQ29_009164 [Apophysomyces sp. BC1021]|nr:hypothetical protein DFQ29_009164 [Apophysomyces sp. BC1021]
MAANYWASSQSQHWLLDRWSLSRSREEDRKYLSETDYVKIKIWNSLRLTDPLLVLVTCVYLATKIEECPIHIKVVTQEAKHVFQVDFGGFPYDSSKVAEFEFYLLEELEFYLVVWHPYRPLTHIASELGMQESGLQYAWFIVNDSYRTDVCLLYPPHMIAIAAIYLTVVMNHADFAPGSVGERTDMRQWFADLNVDIEGIIEISQEILAIYEIWADWKEELMVFLWKDVKNR